MSTAVALLCRVVRRRVERGEELSAVLADYPRLTEKQRDEIIENVNGREKNGYKAGAAHRVGGVPRFWAGKHRARRFMGPFQWTDSKRVV